EALTPVYPTTQGLAQASLRRAIGGAFAEADLSDTLPEAVRRRYGLIGFEQAIRGLHMPSAQASVHALQQQTDPAWTRIKFDELLAQQLSLAAARAARRSQAAPVLRQRDNGLAARLLATLPFGLTGAQRRVVEEIAADM